MQPLSMSKTCIGTWNLLSLVSNLSLLLLPCLFISWLRQCLGYRKGYLEHFYTAIVITCYSSYISLYILFLSYFCFVFLVLQFYLVCSPFDCCPSLSFLFRWAFSQNFKNYAKRLVFYKIMIFFLLLVLYI